MEFQTLFQFAVEARLRAYAPYSHFKVGAALLTLNGNVFTGANVENISFGLTCCAERSAIFSAVGAGILKFAEIVIVADSVEPVAPCGACRQVMAEFAPDMEVKSANLSGLVVAMRLTELLPRAKNGILNL